MTSPEVGPLFGAVVARALDAWWRELGEPAHFSVIEHGAGPGTLARAVIRADPECRDALRYTMVEISDVQRASHPEAPGFYSSDVGPDPVDFGVVLANELLDNLPFGIAQHDGIVWREVQVATENGALIEQLGDEVQVDGWRGGEGARAPLQRLAHTWVQEALGSVGAGRVVAIDYAVGVGELAERGDGWVRTYRHHERGGPILEMLGQQDITTDVVIDQLPVPDLIEEQARFLGRFGIGDLVEEGRRLWEANASSPNLAAIAGRSRSNEADALCDPAGLGAFKVMHWCK